MVRMSQYQGKQLVSFLRKGDYAHAGEEEAIRYAMEPIPKDPKQTILDIGCGLGGTAHFLQQHGWGTVSGFDIETESIEHAKKHYPKCTFYIANLLQADTLPKQAYDILCLFNVFYGISSHKEALNNFTKLAHTKTQLILFDYASHFPAKELSQQFGRDDTLPFNSIPLDSIEDLLKQTDWHLIKLVDQTSQFCLWYQDLVSRLLFQKNTIINKFGQLAYNRAYQTYTAFVKGFDQGLLNGVTLYARK